MLIKSWSFCCCFFGAAWSWTLPGLGDLLPRPAHARIGRVSRWIPLDWKTETHQDISKQKCKKSQRPIGKIWEKFKYSGIPFIAMAFFSIEFNMFQCNQVTYVSKLCHIVFKHEAKWSNVATHSDPHPFYQSFPWVSPWKSMICWSNMWLRNVEVSRA